MKIKPELSVIARLLCFLLPLAFLGLVNSCTYNKNLQPAAATPGTGEGGFELADSNHDGKLSRDEASDFIVGQVFSARDSDHNGQITKKEWIAADPSGAADFRKRDANHDGILTREEALRYGRNRGMTRKAFAEADKNHDGGLDPAEVQSYYASREGSPR